MINGVVLCIIVIVKWFIINSYYVTGIQQLSSLGLQPEARQLPRLLAQRRLHGHRQQLRRRQSLPPQTLWKFLENIVCIQLAIHTAPTVNS